MVLDSLENDDARMSAKRWMEVYHAKGNEKVMEDAKKDLFIRVVNPGAFFEGADQDTIRKDVIEKLVDLLLTTKIRYCLFIPKMETHAPQENTPRELNIFFAKSPSSRSSSSISTEASILSILGATRVPNGRTTSTAMTHHLAGEQLIVSFCSSIATAKKCTSAIEICGVEAHES